MECIPLSQVDHWLRDLGMKLDDWNRIVNISNDFKASLTQYQAPRDALQLLCFSRHAVEWLPRGDWWLLQLDNSTPVDPDTASLFLPLLASSSGDVDLVENRTFVFKFDAGEECDGRLCLQVSNLVFALLLFRCHAYLVSSKSIEGQMLSLQDGFAYLATREQNELKARALISNYERNPTRHPKWVIEIVARYQAAN